MRTTCIIYLGLVSIMFIYVGDTCIRKRHTPASGTLGLICGGLGLILTAAMFKGVI